jgi:hypothetical protein
MPGAGVNYNAKIYNNPANSSVRKDLRRRFIRPWWHLSRVQHLLGSILYPDMSRNYSREFNLRPDNESQEALLTIHVNIDQHRTAYGRSSKDHQLARPAVVKSTYWNVQISTEQNLTNHYRMPESRQCRRTRQAATTVTEPG